jgi:peroxiredoxin
MLIKGDDYVDFTIPNDSGKQITLSKKLSQNSPLFLVFYKFDCPTCQFAFQYLPRIAHQIGDEHFLAIAQDTQVNVSQFRLKYGVKFDIACDTHPYKVSTTYGIDFVPTVFIIESDGKISDRAEGFDRKCIEEFSGRIAQAKQLRNFLPFQPNEQVPLLKPG